jgi:mRNA interferase MazF
MSPQPGDIWLADLGIAAKTRPVVISRQDPNPPRALALYVPLTTQNRLSPYEVSLPRLPFLDRDSVANVQGQSTGCSHQWSGAFARGVFVAIGACSMSFH